MKVSWFVWLVWIWMTASGAAQRAVVLDPLGDYRIDSQDLKVEFRMGFGDTLFTNRENVAVFAVQNDSDRVIEGTIEIDVLTQRNQGEWYHHPKNTWSLAFQLGQQSSQRFSMLFPLLNISRGLIVKIRDHDGTLLWQRYHYPEVPPTDSRTRLRVLTIDEDKQIIPMGPPKPFLPQRNSIRQFPGLGQRDVDFMHTDEWALPDDYAMLRGVDGIVLGRKAGNRLTDRQSQALAEYLAYGGVLLIAEENSTMLDRVLAKQPFEPRALIPGVSLIGLGKVARFPRAAHAPESRDSNQHLYDLLDTNPQRTSMAIGHNFGQNNRYNVRSATRAKGQRAFVTRSMVLWFVGLFTLLTGPVVWMLRRWPRRRFLMALSSTVGVFSIIAVMLGRHLSHSPGELWGTSFTEMSPSGGVQSMVYLLESTGARTHELMVNDLRARFPDPEVSRDFGPSASGSARGRIPVPLLPWTRTAHAVESLAATVQPLGVQVIAESDTKVRVQLANPNVFHIEWMGLKLISEDGADPATASSRSRVHVIRLDGSPDAPVSEGHFPLHRTNSNDGWNLGTVLIDDPAGASQDLNAHFNEFGMNVKREHYVGYLLMRVDRSPHLQLADCDFVETSSTHYVGLRLSAAQLPPFETFFMLESEMPAIESRTKGSMNRRKVRPATSQ